MISWSILALLAADDWTLFRGPAGDGLSAERSAPTTWAPDKNILWKAALPHPCNGSPIVSNGRVFVTGPEDADGLKRSLYCFDRKDGRQLWVRTVDYGKKLPRHGTNYASSSTPAADGKRVVAWHDSAGLVCYDFEGKDLWSRNLGEFRHKWGHGGSPVIHDGKVLLNCGPGARLFMISLDLATGKTVWETEEPFQGDGDNNAKGAHMGSWCTPMVVRGQILCAQPTRVVAYDPADGKILWWCGGLSHGGGDLAYSSPVVVGDVVVTMAGFGGPGLAIRLDGKGDVTETHRLWRHEKRPQSIGSGITRDGVVYLPQAGPNRIDCLDPATGKVIWSEMDPDKSAYWGSIVYAAGRAYVTNQKGTTVVFKPDAAKFEPVAVNRLKESSNSTPALSDGQIFIRTFKHLYCIGE